MREGTMTGEATPRSRANAGRNAGPFPCWGFRIDRCPEVEEAGTFRAGSRIDRLSGRFVQMAARGVAA
jgi:hypothetical protein